MAFDLENYEPVAVRLARLLETVRNHGREPMVRTVLLSEPGADICVMRAELWIDGNCHATGHAEEVRGAGNVNRTSHLENCETSALGRMCEAYLPNPDMTKRPSREEMSKVNRYNSGETSTQNGPRMATDKQKNMIRALAKSVGGLPPTNMDSLTTVQASRVIDDLKQQSAQREAAPDEDPF